MLQVMKGVVFFTILVITATFLFATTGMAHFQGLIPSDDMITKSDNKTLSLEVIFFHPFDAIYMNMAKPVKFGVMVRGKKTDLLGILKEKKIGEFSAWEAKYKVNVPGDHIFYVEPKPYWESSEDCFIVHYAKVVVNSLGVEDGWDEEVGLKTEIVPLSKPFGLYAGNVFQGIVKINGKPVPYAGVEAEYYNQDKKAEAPTDYMVTQTIKADQNGVFTYAVPKAGWWGFAARNTSEKMKYLGEEKDLELGAILWVEFHEWKDE